jgi:hypothetical protein
MHWQNRQDTTVRFENEKTEKTEINDKSTQAGDGY